MPRVGIMVVGNLRQRKFIYIDWDMVMLLPYTIRLKQQDMPLREVQRPIIKDRPITLPIIAIPMYTLTNWTI